MDTDRHVSRETHGYIARGGMQKRIGEAVAEKLHGDRPSASFDLRATAQLEELDAAAAGSHAHRSARAAQPHASALRFGVHGARDVAQIEIAATAHHAQVADALLY